MEAFSKPKECTAKMEDFENTDFLSFLKAEAYCISRISVDSENEGLRKQ